LNACFDQTRIVRSADLGTQFLLGQANALLSRKASKLCLCLLCQPCDLGICLFAKPLDLTARLLAQAAAFGLRLLFSAGQDGFLFTLEVSQACFDRGQTLKGSLLLLFRTDQVRADRVTLCFERIRELVFLGQVDADTDKQGEVYKLPDRETRVIEILVKCLAKPRPSRFRMSGLGGEKQDR
jgi:hypothetical protein